MKKFLAYLMVIVITVSLGFAVFYLVRDNEKISLTTTTLYKDKGSTFELALDMSKNNSYTKISVSSSNEDVVSIANKEIDVKKGVAKATLVANEGGIVRVNFQTNNSKFRNLYCDITIGDGSKENPYHIDNAAQLALIGNDAKYTLSSCYEIVSDINLSLSDDKWVPIGNEANPFIGTINGNGHTIYNGNISNAGKYLGVFASIGAGAKIDNLKFKNISVESSNSTIAMGAVAGTNSGTLTRIEVVDSVIANNYSSVYVGGIVGENKSYFSNIAPVNASIIRASVNAKFVGENVEKDNNAISGVVGGIAGLNVGGTIAYTYSKAPNTVMLSSGISMFGGIVGDNNYVNNPGTIEKYSKDLQGFIRDSYTILNVNTLSASISSLVGGVVGKNVQDTQQVYGCYYVASFMNNISGIGNMSSPDESSATSMDASEMKILSNFVSHIEKQPYYDSTTGSIKYRQGTTIYWDKDIWKVENDTNEGFPILNMGSMDINTSIVSGTFQYVSTVGELWSQIQDNLDGQYYINDMDATGSEWEPIGTETLPFAGQIWGGSSDKNNTMTYSTISNLTVKQLISTNYAGMFGYTSNGAVIKNIVLKNVTVASDNIDIAGGLVGINNGSIYNCMVEGGLVKAKKYVGGLVGLNYGTISRTDNEYTITKSTDAQNKLVVYADNQSEAVVGGIAGQNSGKIEYVNVEQVKLTGQVPVLYLGGVAGLNSGSIQYATVNSQDFETGDASASAGGIVGYTDGDIEYVTSEVTINASKNKDTYVGGIAGIFNAKQDANRSTYIKFANVKNSSLTGKYVGGVVSTLNTEYSQTYNITDRWYKNFLSEQYQVDSNVYNKDLMYAIHAAAVKEDVTLKGTYTGGIAYHIRNGVVLDAYSQANLAGTNNAGIVFNIDFNGETQSGGLMSRIYAIVKFDSGSQNYSVTASNVHSDGWNLANRKAGFIDDYYYCVTKDKGSKDPTYSGGFLIGIGNLFTNDTNRITKRDRKESTMKGTDLWESFTSDSDVTGRTVWITGNGYPTIKGL